MAFKGEAPQGFRVRGGLGLAAFFALALLALSGAGCSKNPIGYCGTQVTDPDELQLVGCVEHENGDPAIGVRVVAIQQGARAKTASDPVSPGQGGPGYETVTESHGLYLFKGLPTGLYTLFFADSVPDSSGRRKAHRIEDVYLKTGFSNKQSPTKLQPTAMLTVTVVNGRNGEGLGNVECRIENTPYRATSTQFGVFILYPLEGEYEVQCESPPFTPNSYPVKLITGENTAVQIPMYEGGIPVTIPMPSNVSATEDSATGIVRVTWSKPVTSELLQYRIRRLETMKTDLLIGWDGVTDTLQYDPVFAGEPDTVTFKIVQYNVASKRGNKYSEPAISKPLRVVRGPAAKVGFLDSARTSCMAGDTVQLLGTYKSRYHHNAQVLWTTPRGEDTLKVMDVDNRAGADTLSYPCAAPGDPTLEFRVKDETGVTSVNAFKFEIVPRP